MRIYAEDFRMERLQELQRASQKKIVSEEEYLEKQREESRLMLCAEEQGLNGALEPELALALARATKDLFEAEERVLLTEVEECNVRLKTLHDSIDAVQARKRDAHFQIGRIVSTMTRHGIPVDLRRKNFQLPTRPTNLSSGHIYPSIGVGDTNSDESSADSDKWGGSSASESQWN